MSAQAILTVVRRLPAEQVDYSNVLTPVIKQILSDAPRLFSVPVDRTAKSGCCRKGVPMQNIAAWLRSLELSEHAERFAENEHQHRCSLRADGSGSAKARCLARASAKDPPSDPGTGRRCL